MVPRTSAFASRTRDDRCHRHVTASTPCHLSCHNVSGAYPSRKMGNTIPFESQTIELWAIYLMRKKADEDVERKWRTITETFCRNGFSSNGYRNYTWDLSCCGIRP